MIDLHQSVYDAKTSFVNYLKSMYNLQRISTKLFNFDCLSFKEFIGELRKQQAKLISKQQMELMPLFEDKVFEIKSLIKKVINTENQLDTLIYKLYGLSEQDVCIIEEYIAKQTNPKCS